MITRKLMSGFAAIAMTGAMFFVATSAQAAMAPAPTSVYAASDIESAGCLLGAHVGPLGACGGGYHHDRHCWVNRWGHRVCN